MPSRAALVELGHERTQLCRSLQAFASRDTSRLDGGVTIADLLLALGELRDNGVTVGDSERRRERASLGLSRRELHGQCSLALDLGAASSLRITLREPREDVASAVVDIALPLGI
jgi:DNA-binding IclR family transcriptional regulator